MFHTVYARTHEGRKIRLTALVSVSVRHAKAIAELVLREDHGLEPHQYTFTSIREDLAN